MAIVKQPIKNNAKVTWEMAAYDSTEELYADVNSLLNNQFKTLRECIDYYIDSKMYFHTDGDTVSHKQKWAIMSANAIKIAKEFDSSCSVTHSEVLNTVIKKQKDYGHKNISKFGITGLVIRVHDKVARVENLAKKQNYINSVIDETMTDTLMDIIGYSIIAYMWLNNTFMYDLAENQ